MNKVASLFLLFSRFRFIQWNKIHPFLHLVPHFYIHSNQINPFNIYPHCISLQVWVFQQSWIKTCNGFSLHWLETWRWIHKLDKVGSFFRILVCRFWYPTSIEGRDKGWMILGFGVLNITVTVFSSTYYLCFGDWDGLLVWIKRIGQPKGWSILINLAF
jgi:hypothetical protein